MPRPATGQVIEHEGKDGRVWRSLRFTAQGKRHTHPLGVVSQEQAARELGFVMADVARGTWRRRARARGGRGPDLPRVLRDLVGAERAPVAAEDGPRLPLEAGVPSRAGVRRDTPARHHRERRRALRGAQARGRGEDPQGGGGGQADHRDCHRQAWANLRAPCAAPLPSLDQRERDAARADPRCRGRSRPRRAQRRARAESEGPRARAGAQLPGDRGRDPGAARRGLQARRRGARGPPACRAASDPRDHDARRPSHQRAVCAALARRGPRRRLAARGRLQDRRWTPAGEDSRGAARRAARGALEARSRRPGRLRVRDAHRRAPKRRQHPLAGAERGGHGGEQGASPLAIFRRSRRS